MHTSSLLIAILLLLTLSFVMEGEVFFLAWIGFFAVVIGLGGSGSLLLLSFGVGGGVFFLSWVGFFPVFNGAVGGTGLGGGSSLLLLSFGVGEGVFFLD